MVNSPHVSPKSPTVPGPPGVKRLKSWDSMTGDVVQLPSPAYNHNNNGIQSSMEAWQAQRTWQPMAAQVQPGAQAMMQQQHFHSNMLGLSSPRHKDKKSKKEKKSKKKSSDSYAEDSEVEAARRERKKERKSKKRSKSSMNVLSFPDNMAAASMAANMNMQNMMNMRAMSVPGGNLINPMATFGHAHSAKSFSAGIKNVPTGMQGMISTNNLLKKNNAYAATNINNDNTNINIANNAPASMAPMAAASATMTQQQQLQMPKYQGSIHKDFDVEKSTIGAAYLMTEDFVERYDLDKDVEKSLKTEFRPKEVIRILCDDDLKLNGVQNPSETVQEKLQAWKQHPSRSRSVSPSGRKRPNILESLRMIDRFCDDFHLDEEAEYLLKHNLNPDETMRTITCGKVRSHIGKSSSPSEFVRTKFDSKRIARDDGRIMPMNEHVAGTTEDLSFLEISNRLCKFMTKGNVDKDTEELLLSRVSVSEAVDMVSSCTLFRVRNPSALVQSKLKDKSRNVDPFHANECWSNFDNYVAEYRDTKILTRKRSVVRPRPGMDGKTTSSSAGSKGKPSEFIGRADANRAPMDPYSRFSGDGGVPKAVGLNLKLPPGLMAKAKKAAQEAENAFVATQDPEETATIIRPITHESIQKDILSGRVPPMAPPPVITKQDSVLIDLESVVIITPPEKAESPNTIPATVTDEHQELLNTQSGLCRPRGFMPGQKPNGGRFAKQFDLIFTAGKK